MSEKREWIRPWFTDEQKRIGETLKSWLCDDDAHELKLRHIREVIRRHDNEAMGYDTLGTLSEIGWTLAEAK